MFSLSSHASHPPGALSSVPLPSSSHPPPSFQCTGSRLTQDPLWVRIKHAGERHHRCCYREHRSFAMPQPPSSKTNAQQAQQNSACYMLVSDKLYVFTRCIVRQSWDILGELYLNYYEDVLPLRHFIFLIQNHIELRDSSLQKEPMRSCFSSSLKYTWPRRIWHSSPHLHHYAVKLTYYVFTTILTTISSLHTITDTLSLLQHERNPLFLPLDDQHTGLFSQRGSGSALHSQPVSLNGRPGIWCTSSF